MNQELKLRVYTVKAIPEENEFQVEVRYTIIGSEEVFTLRPC